MAGRAKDKEAGVITAQGADGKPVPLFDQDIALEILERIAAGELLREIVRDRGMPDIRTIRRWGVNNPHFAKAFESAVRMSAGALEEEAMELGREIKAASIKKGAKIDGTMVRAYEVAMNQLRWSATRRDPARFGEKAPANIQVPVQINTTLALPAQRDDGNIYRFSAKLTAAPEPAPEREVVPDPNPTRKHTLLKWTKPPPEEEPSADQTDTRDREGDVRLPSDSASD